MQSKRKMHNAPAKKRAVIHKRCQPAFRRFPGLLVLLDKRPFTRFHNFMGILKSDNLQALTAARILVVGDLILDHYIRGYTERTSPEAPVPVVIYQSEDYIGGGAANVARNIAATGARVDCIGIAGDDREGELLCDAIKQAGAGCQNILRVAGRITTLKQRIVSQGQQVVRVDREDSQPLSTAVEEQLETALANGAERPAAILVSDYAKGVISDRVLQAIMRRAQRDNIPVIVDPKGRDYARYRGAFALTPNAKEAYEATGIQTRDSAGLTSAAGAIFKMTDCQILTITRGADGVALFQRERPSIFLPTNAREVFDVTGAGDTFVAFLALGCAAGLPPESCAELANIAAGVVVSKSGAAVATLAEIRAALMPGRVGRKLRQVSDLDKLGSELRAQGKKIVFTNGCFDFLHAGHVAFLQRARALGDVLVLATNTDEMITHLKGESRPVIAGDQRLSMLASIEAVDYLVPFEEATPHALLQALKPDLLVKGSNYAHEQVEGHEIIEANGGKVQLLDVVPSIVTHELLAQRRL